jgi:hypothetical protein
VSIKRQLDFESICSKLWVGSMKLSLNSALTSKLLKGKAFRKYP